MTNNKIGELKIMKHKQRVEMDFAEINVTIRSLEKAVFESLDKNSLSGPMHTEDVVRLLARFYEARERLHAKMHPGETA